MLLYQLTVKAVEKDSRNKAPHFLCGSFTEEDSILTVNTPLSTTPFIVKKSMNHWGDAPRSIRWVSECNQAKRVNNQKSNDQTKVDQPLRIGNSSTNELFLISRAHLSDFESWCRPR